MADDALATPTAAHRTHMRDALLAWYDDVKRDLPWRRTDDPYRIWVSEIMLQQTRVDQAAPYYHRFVTAFPTVEALAAADRDDVLKQWEGLGYYSRARYLHEAAQHVVDAHDGTVPRTWDAIRELKGIGPYTAAAVLSIAYEKPHAVLDGNVIRVLTRVFAIDEDSTRSAIKRRLRALANTLIDRARPGDWNQALMELGATVCTPRQPACPECVLQPVCQAVADGRPEDFPVTPESTPIPHHDIAVGLVFNDAGELLIQRRPDEGLLGGLWEFPGGKREEGEELAAACRRELKEELGITVAVGDLFYTLKHAYSHFKITLHAFRCRIVEGTPTPTLDQPFRWVAIDALDDYAFPRANTRLIEELRRRQTEPSLFDTPGA
ncbi:A/G-specific adenine glycosylase [Salisaeta longa]|uniref:A/G-specific adenine glycosylase n=1 Tax=Salisaeta longa TaxID=503170 RepID=UPI0003B41958|nr:A/G-specific adenine glycosylase [Salisaeta longa]